MTITQNHNQTAFEKSSFKQQEVYAFKLNDLTLIYPQKLQFSQHPILSFNGLRSSFMSDSDVIFPFLFAKKNESEHFVPPPTPFILYAPSLLTIWALAAQKKNPSLIKIIINKNSLSKKKIIYFKWRLHFERFRLGSDVESFFARRLLYYDGLGANIPPISIKQWLEWIEICMT